MQNRNSSLSKVNISGWKWQKCFDQILCKFKDYSINPCKIDNDFLDKKSIIGSSKNIINTHISTWACSTKKIRKARAVCLEASPFASVLNFVITPKNVYDMPFFGADFVTLPNYHLLALDLQPALKYDALHTKDIWEKIIPLHDKWQDIFPHGGDIPKDAKNYFSPGFLWTKLPINDESENKITNPLVQCLDEYLDLYFYFLNKSEEVSKDRSMEILSGQKSYMNYRILKDPAKNMLNKFFGLEWTTEYLNEVLFDLKN